MDLAAIRERIDDALGPMGFEARAIAPIEDHAVGAAWVRKTWNTNRGIAALEVPAQERPGPFAQRLKIPLGKAMGYFPFFYGIGLQVILLSDTPAEAEDLQRFVDTVDNQRAIIQSLHVVDPDGRTCSVRTWGQIVTGKFQDAIERALRG